MPFTNADMHVNAFVIPLALCETMEKSEHKT